MNAEETPLETGKPSLQEILLRFRKTFNLKQNRMAELLSMSEKQYSSWERGKASPHVLTIEGIQARLRKYIKIQAGITEN